MLSAGHRWLASALVGLALLLAACGAPADPSASGAPSAAGSATAAASALPSSEPSATDGDGEVEPAPGSDSDVYAPNPGAIVVAIDAGHGGCLDWGVPDPSERGVELAEKTLTLDIARRLRDRLEAEGIEVVMIRDADVALAGDDYPDLGCEGPDWRDVNGDGEAGFTPEGNTRTRDELQARLDVANLARADAFVSIHINSPFDGGQRIEVAFSETFYTDETPWGDRTADLAGAIQDGVVSELGALAEYERGDRGITAHNFYIVAPTLIEPTPDRPNPFAQPTRQALMPTVLAEVGSITLRAEHDLLASPAGQSAVADGLYTGLARFIGSRPAAARIEPDDPALGAPLQLDSGGPPFWAPVVGEESVRLRVTNTGTEPLEAGSRLVAGWQVTDQPYLVVPPESPAPVGAPLPPLAPGESVAVEVDFPGGWHSGRQLAWISLLHDGTILADLGSPPLQLASQAP